MPGIIHDIDADPAQRDSLSVEFWRGTGTPTLSDDQE